MDVDGSSPINLSRSPGFDGWPWWSPDSKQIVFASNRSGPANVGQLYVINADGKGLHKITDSPASLAQPNWSKTGNLIYAFQSWETSEYEYGSIIVLEVRNP